MIITNILKIILKEDIFLPMKYQQEIRYSIFQIKQSLTMGNSLHSTLLRLSRGTRDLFSQENDEN